MAVVYVTEHTNSTLYFGGLLPVVKMPPVATQTIAIGGASTQSSAFNTATHLACIHTDAICSIEFGTNPTATSSSRRLAANSTEYFEVIPGQKVAVITNS